MKKLLFIAAAAAGMVAVADVQSANTVGYTGITIKPGLNMIGTSFFKVDDMGRFDINATFTDCKGNSNAGAGDSEADTIEVWNSVNQGYANQRFYFYAYPEEPDPEWDYHWLDNFGEYGIATFVIPSANGFWYRNRSNKTFTLTSSGSVGNEDIEITLKPGLNMIVNPFPCEWTINSAAANWKEAGCNAGPGDSEADTIEVWNSTNQGYANQRFYFYAYPEEPDPDWDYHWLDNFGEYGIATFVIPVNGGFWYRNRGNADIKLTIKCPLVK